LAGWLRRRAQHPRADKSDCVWNYMDLYPNCHRESHYSPEHDAINAELLEYASGFRVAEAA